MRCSRKPSPQLLCTQGFGVPLSRFEPFLLARTAPLAPRSLHKWPTVFRACLSTAALVQVRENACQWAAYFNKIKKKGTRMLIAFCIAACRLSSLYSLAAFENRNYHMHMVSRTQLGACEHPLFGYLEEIPHSRSIIAFTQGSFGARLGTGCGRRGGCSNDVVHAQLCENHQLLRRLLVRVYPVPMHANLRSPQASLPEVQFLNRGTAERSG